MAKGVFSGDITTAFSDVLADFFAEGGPAHQPVAPPPQSSLPSFPDGAGDPPRPPMELIDFLTDAFEFASPTQATVENAQAGVPRLAEKWISGNQAEPEMPNTSLDAIVEDFGPLFAPGGNGGGKPGGGPGGPGGGGGGPKGGNTPAVEFTTGAVDSGSVDNFNIQFQFYGSWAANDPLVVYLAAAGEFLSGIITQGFADDPDMFNSFDTGTAITVDDLLVEVFLGNLRGGVAAATEIYAANDFNGGGMPETPAGATITFNKRVIDDLDALGTLDDVALHEMMHALGFGLWETADNDLTASGGGSITYTGTAGGYVVGDLFVENEGLTGSVGGHWAEVNYEAELMTSVVENTDTMYLSDYSIASLTDLAVVTQAGGSGYVLASDWEDQLADLNGTSNTGGIDLDAWSSLA